MWSPDIEDTAKPLRLTPAVKRSREEVLRLRPNAVLMRYVETMHRTTNEYASWRVFDGSEALGPEDHGSEDRATAWKLASAYLRQPNSREAHPELPPGIAEYELTFAETDDEVATPLRLYLTEDQRTRLFALLQALFMGAVEADDEEVMWRDRGLPAHAHAARWRAFVTGFDQDARHWQKIFDDEAAQELKRTGKDLPQ